MPRGTQPHRRAGLTGAAVLGAGAVLSSSAALAARRPAAPAASADADGQRSTDTTSSTAPLALSARAGALRGGTAVSATGSALQGVAAVTVGGLPAVVTAAEGGRVDFRTPAAQDFAAGDAPVVLADAHGDALARSTWTYRAVDGTDRQLADVLRYWQHYNPAWDALPDDDCVDFTSQALLARGWRQQDDWYHAADITQSGTAWRGSTAFMSFMQAHPSLGTALGDDQRSRVKPGDVVQFDWDRSGDRDHTGTVTRVVQQGGRWQVFFAGHTDDSDYRSVDDAITKDHPGGLAYYWSLA